MPGMTLNFAQCCFNRRLHSANRGLIDQAIRQIVDQDADSLVTVRKNTGDSLTRTGHIRKREIFLKNLGGIYHLQEGRIYPLPIIGTVRFTSREPRSFRMEA